jgi:DNA-binding XRE family transcriptional regulator
MMIEKNELLAVCQYKGISYSSIKRKPEIRAMRKNLKNFRKSAGLSLRGMGDSIGYSHAHVSAIERGEFTPSLGYLVTACVFFDIKLEDIFK